MAAKNQISRGKWNWNLECKDRIPPSGRLSTSDFTPETSGGER